MIGISKALRIGIIGDFDRARPSHIATNEALRHCAAGLGIEIELQWLPTEELETVDGSDMAVFDGLWCAPGSPYRSMEGALRAIHVAREGDIPFLGTCGGFQHAVIEYARNALGLADARHSELDGGTELFITALSCSLVGETRKILLRPDTMVHRIYGQAEAEERYNCSFGLNPVYQAMLDDNGFKIAGTDEQGEARMLELPRNRFYVATLFQPQLSSTPEDPHKLITAYLRCAMG